MRKTIVTGGAGFIGSHLVEQLVKRGDEVTVIDLCTTGSLANLKQVKSQVQTLSHDLRQLNWEKVLEDCDLVFHLGANAYVPPSVERPAWDCELNFGSTFRLLEAIRESRWKGALIYASSAAVYGNPAKLPIQEDDPTVPISPYGVAKLAAERYIAVYSQLYDIKAASLRFFSIFGPRQKKQVIFDLMRKIEDNPRQIQIYGDGTQLRDFNYVVDTAAACVLVSEAGKLAGEVYNVASGYEVSILQLAQEICQVMKANPKFSFTGDVRPGDAQRWTVDIGKLSGIGYAPRFSLAEGLGQTYRWYQSLDHSSDALR